MTQGAEPVSELVERLQARAAKVQSHIENSQRVVELMQPELDRFNARAGHNVYATRLAVDHVSAIRTDTKELADWTEAADRIQSIEAQLSAAQEAGERMRQALRHAEQDFRNYAESHRFSASTADEAVAALFERQANACAAALGETQ